MLDLSKQQLQKIPKQPADVALHVRILLLDENELQKIDNVDSYTRLEHVRAAPLPFLYHCHAMNI